MSHTGPLINDDEEQSLTYHLAVFCQVSDLVDGDEVDEAVGI